MVLKVGTLDDPSLFGSPQIAIYTVDKQPYHHVPEGMPAFERLRQQGKIRFLGITAVGDTAALNQVIDAGAFDSAQMVYNMLNPSAAEPLPANYPAQDYARMFDHTKAAGVGVVGIRVLAGGALSGSAERRGIA